MFAADATPDASRPLFLFDVDGVLNRDHASRKAAKRSGCRTYSVTGPDNWRRPFHAHPDDRTRIHALSGVFDLAWATTWQSSASRDIARVLGMPQALPYATWEPGDGVLVGYDGHELSNKVPGVLRLVAGRPFVWADDEHAAFSIELAKHPAPAHLMLPVDSLEGLTDGHVETVKAWARNHAAW